MDARLHVLRLNRSSTGVLKIADLKNMRRFNTMTNVVWKSPSPSSGFHRGVNVQFRHRREIALTFEFEDESDQMRNGELVFRGVVHYSTTYLPALQSDLICKTYDQVVDEGESPELLKMKAAMEINGWPTEIRHYRLGFDDGPCFEFFAEGFGAFIS